MVPCRIVAFSRYYSPAFRAGGPLQTLRAMIETHQQDHAFLVITSNRDWGVKARLKVASNKPVQVGSATVLYGRSNLVAMLARSWRGVTCGTDFVYLSSAFDVAFGLAPLIVTKMRRRIRPTILVAPRGEFGAGALRQKRRKKAVFLRFAKLVGLYRGVVWHASTDRERDEILRIFPNTEVVVRENESLLPTSATNPDRPHGPLRVVFVSRISPKKGLHRLLEALAKVSVPVVVDIYGSTDKPGYLQRCKALAARVPAHVQVHFHGPVPHEQVREVFGKSDLFAFPTSHENFGHTIAEALSMSTPVFLADVTPWTHRLRSTGIDVLPQDDPAAWAQAMDDYAALDADRRTEYRRRAERAFNTWASEQPNESVFEPAGRWGRCADPRRLPEDDHG